MTQAAGAPRARELFHFFQPRTLAEWAAHPETLRRHTFKTAARRCMGAEWHDRLTGHAHRTVGETYGDYDLRTSRTPDASMSITFTIRPAS